MFISSSGTGAALTRRGLCASGGDVHQAVPAQGWGGAPWQRLTPCAKVRNRRRPTGTIGSCSEAAGLR